MTGIVKATVGGSWMVATPGEPGPRYQHFVPNGADTETYSHGYASRAACRVLCLPAGAGYRAGIVQCPDCLIRCPRLCTSP
jgi:hypothetical protein